MLHHALRTVRRAVHPMRAKSLRPNFCGWPWLLHLRRPTDIRNVFFGKKKKKKKKKKNPCL
eukprot:NODE_26354_length_554_cov_1.159251.p4 GENE.NODE_26354_length_554_cov_1.159251~~NODE_26354_length_554_cov_1.159251.p4  ORF type:complete len:61 (+),score=24.45 NODE_26354_length_554_cov_1.159251:304-486(+)